MNRLSAGILFDFIGRVITYVKRATRNYLVMFGNVANGDILRAHFSQLLQKSEIYCLGFVASDMI